MPNLEPVVLEGRGFTVRHVGPITDLYPNGISPIKVSSFVVINQPAMIARDLPMSNIPNSPDMVSGNWVGRVMDAGDFSLTFPNKEASDGVSWRNRFKPDLKNQWIEIRNDEYVESACCIEKIDYKRDQIVISGHDGLFQTKSAYERDWVVVRSPRDVIERGTQVWHASISDDFSYDGTSTPNAQWTVSTGGGGTALVQINGGLKLSTPQTLFALAEITSSAMAVPSTTNVWTATCNATNVTVGTNTFTLQVTESNTDIYQLAFVFGQAQLIFNPGGGSSQTIGQVTVAAAPSVSLLIESDGEWVYGFVNGQLVGCGRRVTATTSSLQTSIVILDNNTSAATATLTTVLVEHQHPFLQNTGTSTDKGDYALPSTKAFATGIVSTYPSGGLHARYYNDLDLQSDANRILKVLSPIRSQAYTGSGSAEYQNQQDATINGQANPLPGAATSGWSAVWFGAIYLPLSKGNVNIQINNPSNVTSGTAIRCWIGKTKFGDQLLDQWSYSSGVAASAFTVSASALAGTLPYGSGTISRDGWYPIKIEFAVDSTAAVAPSVYFQRSGPAFSWTDPGGTTIDNNAGSPLIVPATSLSPLGMVDQRYQGVSHFDMVTKTALAFGYQVAVEPQSLESGSFPGILAPRFREGQDFDTILEPDNHARAEGIIDYNNVEDATDICTTLFGNGAGFQNGTTGQLQSKIYDHTHLSNSLFDIQAWQDFSDASYASLLQALLNSQLGLRLDPWQVVSGAPVGRPRLANLWPLPSALAQMRWRPGDGLRVRARDVNIEDTSPRQILMITRQIHPNGSTGTQVSFAARPRSNDYAIKQAMFQATRWQRNYQKQLVTLSGAYFETSLAPGATGAGSAVLLSPGDIVVRVRFRINVNTGGTVLNIIVNGVDQTSALNGPWGSSPINIELGPVATVDSFSRLFAAVKNTSGVTTTTVDYQLLVDVLR